MKASEKKEMTQVFEFDKTEVVECFGTFLKGKGIIIPEKAEFSFDVKVNATSRVLESVKLTTKFLEEGPTTPTNTNGKDTAIDAVHKIILDK